MDIRKYFFVIISLFFLNLNAQVSPVVNVDFNGCVVADNGSVGSSVALVGNASCECGLEEESLEFDGIDDGVVFDSTINFIFNQDFTIEFYFTVFNTHDIVDLLSLKRNCDSDSAFSLIYLPSINELRFSARETQFRSAELSITLDSERCWHHFALIRKGFSYTLYIDGKVSVLGNAEKEFTFHPQNKFSISNGACLNDGSFNFRRFKGRIDDFKIYNIALNEIMLNTNAIKSDIILNQDTTIFLGSSVDVRMGVTCADDFTWTNVADLDDSDILTPVITPLESNVYHIYFQMRGKVCKDSLKIYVKNRDELDCSNLLLPNSFTPNGDNLNEEFGISNKYIIEELKSFEVYDRLGTRVFKTNDKDEMWDGIYNDKKLNPCKLVYRVRYICKGEEHNKKGIVNLLR